ERDWVAIAAVAFTAGVAGAGDTAGGEAVFKKCLTCHSKLGETAQNMVGPVLNGLKGRKSGTVPGFSYSDANKNSGIVWDEGPSRNTSKIPRRRSRGPKWFFRGLRTRRKSTICGATSS